MAVSFTKAQLAARFPEFASETEARVQAMLTMARDFVDETAMGAKATTALMLYTAHLLASTTAGLAGKAGPVTAERVGDLSRSFGSPSADSNDLKTTTYGQLFLKLARNEALPLGTFVQQEFVDEG